MSKHAETPTGPKKSGVPILAIAAGAALLLSGGSTLAYWSVQQTATLDEVQTGDLDLSLEEAVWRLNGTQVLPGDVANLKIVPSDTVTITQPLNLTLVGNNLSAELSVDDSGVVAPGNDIDVSSTISGLTEVGGVYPVTPATLAANPNIAAILTVEFNEDTPNQDSTGLTINLDALQFTLTQVPTP